MQAWFCDTLDGVNALQWREAPTPEPGAGEVRIAVKAASLNFPDLLIVQNKYQMKPPLLKKMILSTKCLWPIRMITSCALVAVAACTG